MIAKPRDANSSRLLSSVIESSADDREAHSLTALRETVDLTREDLQTAIDELETFLIGSSAKSPETAASDQRAQTEPLVRHVPWIRLQTLRFQFQKLKSRLDHLSDLPPGEIVQMAARERQQWHFGKQGHFTNRERLIVELVIAGHTNRAIATRLYISQRTVESHRAAAMKKIGAHSLAELVRFLSATS